MFIDQGVQVGQNWMHVKEYELCARTYSINTQPDLLALFLLIFLNLTNILKVD